MAEPVDAEEVSSALQRIADRLAERIGRPVDLDDHHLRLLAHSSHSQEVDPVRLASILHRSAPAPVTAHLRSIGVHEATAPLRVPAAPHLGMDARLCVPIRAGRTLLGFLWLLDDGALDERAMRAATEAAQEAASVLEQARLARIGLLRRAQALVLQAVGQDAGAARVALAALVSEGLLQRADGLHVAVIRELEQRSVGRVGAGGQRGHAAATVAAVRHAVAEGEAALAIDGQDVLVLLCLDDADAVERVLQRVLEEMAESVAGVASVSEAPPSRALERARLCARLAAGRGGDSRLRLWEQLGPYRYLAGLGERSGGLRELEPRVWELAQEASGRDLLLTLECFLDLAGQARPTATRLNLHRSSLYHRLARAEELLGIDLHDGLQRLDVHLALKAARMEGLLRAG